MKLQWRDASLSSAACTNWGTWLDSKRSIDPYLMWADLTDFAGCGGLDRSSYYVPILVELDDAWRVINIPADTQGGAGTCRATGKVVCRDPKIEFSLFSINGAHLQPSSTLKDHNSPRGKYVTGRILRSNIQPLLECCDGHVHRFQLGLARIPALDGRRTEQGEPPDAGAGPFAQVVVGVIDSGFALLHPAFQTRTGDTRIMAFWDQDHRAVERVPKDGPKPGAKPTWKAVTGYNYGAETDNVAINAILRFETGSRSPYALARAYKKLDYVPMDLDSELRTMRPEPYGTTALAMLTATHGTSVLDLAAGNIAPLDNFRVQQTQFGPVFHAEDEVVGNARAWPLVLVQLPCRMQADTSGGSLGLHVVDGIRYILDRARSIPYRNRADLSKSVDLELVPPPNASSTPFAYQNNQVVINLSYGAHAGPHDGSSILEKALRAYAGENGTRIVIAAGNAHQSRTHVHLRLTRGQEQEFFWRVGADNPLEAYLEVWLPRSAEQSGADGGTALAGDFALFVRAPGSDEICRLNMGQALELADPGQRLPVAAAIFARKVVQGEQGTMILLACAPTRRPLLAAGRDHEQRPRGYAPHGDWQLKLQFGGASANASAETVDVHAWAERNDLLFGTVRAQQSQVWKRDPVPSPTEQAPSVIEFCRFGDRAFTAEAPEPFRPPMSVGSVTSGPVPDPRYARSPAIGAVVTVGGYRAADLEMASYSGGGPDRESLADRAVLAGGRCKPAPAEAQVGQPRHRPDLDAVSDLGAATRGIPTASMQPGVQARLSGTSAAAPTVVRALAEMLFMLQHDPGATASWQSGGWKRMFVKPDEDPSQDRPLWPELGSARGTLEPTKDDRYRRGGRRLPTRLGRRRW